VKALVVEAYGPPQNARIADVPAPQIKDGFLLVRIHAAAVNPFDYKLVTGAMKDSMHLKFPYVPGMDGAGEVDAVGSGVEGWKKGDAIVGIFRRGAFAEYAVISASEKRLTRKPETLDYAQAAALPQSGLTAKTMVRAAGDLAGRALLMNGATGGVGLFATQLAKAQGAHVIASGKTADDEYLRQLGADDVIDYSAGDTIAQVRQRYPKGVDAVFDLVNSGESLIAVADVLREGGTLVSTLWGPDKSALAKNVIVHYIQMAAEEGDLEDLARRAAAGTLRIEVGRTYGLEHAAQALADLIDRSKHIRGKLVIVTPSYRAPQQPT
jgi:NADPH:quinone reductase